MYAVPTSPGPVYEPFVDLRPEDQAWPPMRWPPDPGQRLVGDAVALTPLDPDVDAEALFVALDDEVVWRHLPLRVRSPQELAESLRGRIGAGQWPWSIRLVRPLAGLPAGAVVGTSSYLDVSPHDARLEIGWTAYTRAVWASAVNPESKLLLLGNAFQNLRAGRVQLKTDVRNVRSQRAIARLGARPEGVLRRYQRRADGTVRDTVLFSVTAEEWPAVRSGLRQRLYGG